MDMERNCSIVEDINEQYSQWQPRSGSLEKNKSEPATALDGAQLVAQTNVQLENVEEIENEKEFGHNKMVVYLSIRTGDNNRTHSKAHPN